MKHLRLPLALVFSIVLSAQQIPLQPPPDPALQIPRNPIPSTIKDGFVFAAAGDLIYGRPQVPLNDPEFEKVAKLLRSADVAFANAEMSILDVKSFKGYPAAENGGGTPTGEPAVAQDYKNMGLRMVSRANNHAIDWGIEGLEETARQLDAAGVVHAGSGRSRPASRAPAFLETPRGRVALVATASTFPPMAMAGDAAGESPARPGISVMRTRRIHLVTSGEMTSLRTMAAARRGSAQLSRDAPEITVFGETYRVADKPGFTYEMDRYDHFEVLKAIRGAKQTSDFTAFSIHAHETVSEQSTEPGDFLAKLFHNAIDAGADIVATHGTHVLAGIEIYKGKPIFYGLGSLIFQLDLYHATTSDVLQSLNLDPRSITYADYHDVRFGRNPPEWYESAVAISEFQGGRLKEVRLYPLDLGAALDLRHRGVPRLASPELSQKIFERLRRYSAPYGTEIRIENNIGIIRGPQ